MAVPRAAATALALIALLVAGATGATSAAAQPDGQDRMAPGPPHDSNVVVGELPPTAFVLASIDGETYDLAAARGEHPVLVLFFRGVW